MASKNEIDPRKVEYLPLSELTPDDRNPKDHDTETIDSSIGRFGMLDLIVRDERTGKIISGHGRRKVLSAMAERGEDPPEGVKQDGEGNWLVPVVTGWASRTDTEAAAALIAMNRTTELGGWVDDSLLELLDDLSDSSDDLGEAFAGVGFDEDALVQLRERVEADDAMDAFEGLGEMNDGFDGGGAEFKDSPEGDFVTLSVVMTRPERGEVLEKLNEIISTNGGEMSDALLHLVRSHS